MDTIKRRIDRLMEAADMLADTRARRQPFAEIRIYSLMDNRACVYYQPEGVYSAPERIESEMTLEQAVTWCEDHRVSAHTDLLLCMEWAHAYFQRCEGLTDEQKARMKSADIEHKPQIRQLYEMANAETVIDLLAAIPQHLMLK